MVRNLIPLLLVAVPTAAVAQNPEVDAEKLRLIEECNKLAQRNAWAGVERCYEKLEALPTDLPFEMHYLGSQAARNQGKVYEVYLRLTRAKELDPTPEILDNLEAIDKSYGRVDIKGSAKRQVPLTRDVMPFAPDERKAIEWAQTVTLETGSFKGMLPVGTYKVGNTEITVEAGPDWQVVDVRGQGSRSGLIEWKNVVAIVGYNFAFSNAPGEEEDRTVVQPDQFIGNGVAVVLGYEVGFYDPIGAAVGVGYNGMYGVDTFHSAYGWLALVLRPGDLRMAVGPLYAFHGGQGTGVTSWYSVDHDQELFANDQIQFRGFSLAPGAHLSVGYSLMDFGKLAGVVELGGMWSTDGVRQYINAGLRVGIVPQLDRFEQ